MGCIGFSYKLLWLKYRQLSNIMIEDPLGRIYDALLMRLIKERVSLQTNQPFQCSFGFKELADIARIPQSEHNDLLRRLLLTKRISINKNNIFVRDSLEILRQAEYYRCSKIPGRTKSG
jgi:hypothetical protein